MELKKTYAAYNGEIHKLDLKNVEEDWTISYKNNNFEDISIISGSLLSVYNELSKVLKEKKLKDFKIYVG